MAKKKKKPVKSVKKSAKKKKKPSKTAKKVARKKKPTKTAKKSAPKSSKSKPSTKKGKKKTVFKKKSSPSAKTAKLKAVKAVKAEKTKAQLVERPLIPLTTPFKLFQEVWNPAQESFIGGLRKLFTLYQAPGKTDAQREENSAQIIEKIESALRKEPMPKEILAELAERYPENRVRQIASIFALKPRLTIRLNSLRVDIQGFADSKAGSDFKAKRCHLSPWAFDITPSGNPIQSPLYERGLFEIEDEASQLTALLANARPGQRVLDLCAREGDHTLTLACMMKNKGSLFVYDADPEKLKVLKARANKAGVENTRILSDSQVAEVKSLDAVLVDAPCSGTGMLARQPEIKARFKKDELGKIHRLQAALLREAARKLKLGGHLIYATSSLNRSENEGQIENFLKSAHNSYKLVPGSEYVREFVLPYVQNFLGLQWSDELLQSLFEFDPFFVCSPDVHGSNGLFVAILERTRISS